MISPEGLAILAQLTEDEKKLMRETVRIAKSRSNIFSEGELERRKACQPLNVPGLLQSLSNKGLMSPVRRHVWSTTSLGRELEHYLEYLDFQTRLGYKVRRGR